MFQQKVLVDLIDSGATCLILHVSLDFSPWYMQDLFDTFGELCRNDIRTLHQYKNIAVGSNDKLSLCHSHKRKEW